MNIAGLVTFLGIVVVSTIVISIIIFIENKNKKKWGSIADYIESYEFPVRVIEKWKEDYPEITKIPKGYGEKALKQFFMIYAKNKYMKKKTSFDMPSKAVDALWHQFILSSKDYHNFCNIAFGEYLHHNPHDKPKHTNLTDKNLSNQLINTFKASKGLDRASWVVGALPLVFAIDAMIELQDGFKYDASNIETQLATVKNNEGSSGGGCNGFVATACSSDSSDGGGCGGD